MKEGKTKRIDELVDQVMQSLGLYNQYKEQEIYSIWPEVVGRMIAERTRKLEVVNGRLFVSFTSAVVRNEMMMVKEGLVRSLNERIGRDVIKELVIR
jgi:predicted nucleic acid-binding Zn ribbon protein